MMKGSERVMLQSYFEVPPYYNYSCKLSAVLVPDLIYHQALSMIK